MNQTNKNANQLIYEKSPYLLQHAYNPVNWYAWSDAAFEKAKTENKPVFLSIGYSSCHWCHVMERECFEDMEVAELLNRDFISIKVDREERPDVDHLYMEACMLFTGQGGWPLSVFLSSERHSFYAGTYFPKNDRYGMVGFVSLLKHIASNWKTNQEDIIASGKEVMSHLKSTSNATAQLGEKESNLAYQQFLHSFDKEFGGFGGAPKFPSVQNLLFLLRFCILNKNTEAKDMVNKTLSCMAAGGIFDHIGGGFFRYSTDRKWLVPHFEKMLYDNAMLLIIYVEASVSIDTKYASIAHRIVEYCFAEMLGSNGGFFTAEDADSEGVEGKMYLWIRKEIIAVLGEEAGRQFCMDYDITNQGNVENKNLPNRIGNDFILKDDRLPKLLAYRKKRVHPFKDCKVLTSSNGLMVAALSIAGHLLKEEKWIAQAERTADAILKDNVVHGRLMARWLEGEVAHLATLTDYAYFIWGLIELYQATFDVKWLELANDWAERMLELFSDESGGLFLSGKDVVDMPIRQKEFRDNALPSGNAIAASNLIRLSALLENEQFSKEADKILSSTGADISEIPMAYTGLLCAHMLKENNIHVTIAAGEQLEKMLEAFVDFNPFVTSCVCGKGFEAANILLPFAEDRRTISGKATAYVCDKFGCKPPLENPSSLEKLLKGESL